MRACATCSAASRGSEEMTLRSRIRYRVVERSPQGRPGEGFRQGRRAAPPPHARRRQHLRGLVSGDCAAPPRCRYGHGPSPDGRGTPCEFNTFHVTATETFASAGMRYAPRKRDLVVETIAPMVEGSRNVRRLNLVVSEVDLARRGADYKPNPPPSIRSRHTHGADRDACASDGAAIPRSPLAMRGTMQLKVVNNQGDES